MTACKKTRLLENVVLELLNLEEEMENFVANKSSVE